MGHTKMTNRKTRAKSRAKVAIVNEMPSLRPAKDWVRLAGLKRDLVKAVQEDALEAAAFYVWTHGTLSPMELRDGIRKAKP